MKGMTSYLIIAGFLVTINLRGQGKCDTSNVSQEDKILMGDFWTKFKDALNAKDVVGLSALVKFPFNCDRCIIDSSRQIYKPSIKVTKKQFNSNQYKIFFKKQLIEAVNKYQMPKDIDILTLYSNTVDRKRYTLSYIAVTETKKYPGYQELFDIEKIHGQFKVVSTWTIP